MDGLPHVLRRVHWHAAAAHRRPHAAIGPYGPFRCAGGAQVFLGIQNEREWARFCEQAVGDPGLATDPRFVRNSARAAHRAAVNERIEQAFAALEATTVADRLDTAGIANARLRDIAEFVGHPQLLARDRWRQVDTEAGPIRALVPPAMLDGDEPVLNPVPVLGAHTAAILAELGLAGPDAPAGGTHRSDATDRRGVDE